MAIERERLKFFAGFIERELGIVYSEENYFQLEKRLVEIASSLGFSQFEGLWQDVQKGISEEARKVILSAATNNETSFFRDSRLFSALKTHIVPEIARLQGTKGADLRIWSAACSTGQEPYSLAIILSDLRAAGSGLEFNILATDVCAPILARAKAGEFTQLEVQRGMPAEMLIRHFEKASEKTWRVKPYLREKIRFGSYNLIEPWGALGAFEIIFCRNVLIYQNTERKKEIVARLCKHIVLGGFLILGSAENALSLSDCFEQRIYDGAVVYVRRK
jgi:chemotaxis protein methyltransferase CheR